MSLHRPRFLVMVAVNLGLVALIYLASRVMHDRAWLVRHIGGLNQRVVELQTSLDSVRLPTQMKLGPR